MFDVAVVGLGAMGASVAWHAARLGSTVLGLDRHEPPHTLGSTHAETRITRLAVGEGDQYLPFVRRSHELWRALGQETDQTLLYETGGYIVSEAAEVADRWTDFTRHTLEVAERGGVACEPVAAAELRRRHPVLRVPDEASICFEPTAGIVLCERAVEAQLAQARRHGADLHTGQPAERVEPRGDHVAVHTATSVFEARHVVLAAGPWTSELTPTGIGDALTVTRQVVQWYEADDPAVFAAERFPFVMWIRPTIQDYFAVFPTPPDSAVAGVKVLGEQFDHTTTPDTVDRTVTTDETADFHRRLIAPSIDGITDRCVRAEVCLYTSTPDDHFVIDADPRSEMVAASPALDVAAAADRARVAHAIDAAGAQPGDAVDHAQRLEHGLGRHGRAHLPRAVVAPAEHVPRGVGGARVQVPRGHGGRAVESLHGHRGAR